MAIPNDDYGIALHAWMKAQGKTGFRAERHGATVIIVAPPGETVPTEAQMQGDYDVEVAALVEDGNRETRIKANNGQGNSIPELRARIDDLGKQAERKGRV